MILLVEKQREVNQSYTGVQENNAFLIRTQQGAYGGNKGGQDRGRGGSISNIGKGRGRNNDKAARYCDYFNAQGHTRDTCFQLNGYPD